MWGQLITWGNRRGSWERVGDIDEREGEKRL